MAKKHEHQAEENMEMEGQHMDENQNLEKEGHQMDENIKKAEHQVDEQMEKAQNLTMGLFDGQRKMLDAISEGLRGDNGMLTAQEVYGRSLEFSEQMADRIFDAQRAWAHISLTPLSAEKMPDAAKQWCARMEDAADRIIDSERQIFATWSGMLKAMNPLKTMNILSQGNGNGSYLLQAWRDAGERILQVQSDMMESVGSSAQKASKTFHGEMARRGESRR